MKKRISLFLIFVLMAALAIGCGKGSNSGNVGKEPDEIKENVSNNEQESEKIIISEMRGESWLPIYIAEMLGYFEDEGLETEFVVYKDGPGKATLF